MKQEPEIFTFSGPGQHGQLLDSMVNFVPVIEPLLRALAVGRVCEVGIGQGTMTAWLLEYCREHQCRYVGIDPAAEPRVVDEIKRAGQVAIEQPCGSTLGALELCDAYFLDGDPNYYTVQHGLELILERAKAAGAGPCIFLHGLSWPNARRDLYYSPKRVPEEYRRPASLSGGVVVGRSATVEGRGLRAGGSYACHEGGPRNGVLTAVEDVLARNRDWELLRVNAVFGLGVLYRPGTLTSQQVGVFESLKQGLAWTGPLLEGLEANRVRLYLKSLEDDGQRRSAAAVESTMVGDAPPCRSPQRASSLRRLGRVLPGIPLLSDTGAGLRALRALAPLAWRSLSAGRDENPAVCVTGSLARLLPSTAGYRLVSFDLFDTLLERDVAPPLLVKHRVAKYASLRLGRLGFHHSYLAVHAQRDHYEQVLRAEALQRGEDSETTLRDIVRRQVQACTGLSSFDELVEELLDYEVRAEQRHLRPIAGARELLAAIRGRGQRCIVVSDMYLDSRQLRQLLDGADLGTFVDHVYVSSELGKNKGSGRLFERVLDQEEVAPGDMIHVGDNVISDCVRPHELGIATAWLFRPGSLRARLARERLFWRVHAERDHKSLEESLRQRCPRAPSPYQSGGQQELFDLGRRILGPLFTLFMLESLESCHRNQVDRVYFLAREGALLRQLHEVLVERVDRFHSLPQLPTHYLYVSRLSTALASVHRLGQAELGLARLRNGRGSFRDLLTTFTLPSESFADIFLRLGISPEEQSLGDPQSEASSERLLQDPEFRARLTMLASEARQRLRRFLAQEGFFGSSNRCAFVDVGWNGTIQYNITRAFALEEDFPTLFGFFMNRHYYSGYDYHLSPRSMYGPGVVFDAKRGSAYAKTLGRLAPLFEIAAMARHGSTVGYRNEHGRVVPDLAPYNDEMGEAIEALQRGILDSACWFADSYHLHESDSRTLLAGSLVELERFLLMPTPAEVRAVRRLSHEANWGTADKQLLVGPPLQTVDLLSPRRARAHIRAYPWFEGTLCSSPAPVRLGWKVARWAASARRLLASKP